MKMPTGVNMEQLTVRGLEGCDHGVLFKCFNPFSALTQPEPKNADKPFNGLGFKIDILTFR